MLPIQFSQAAAAWSSPLAASRCAASLRSGLLRAALLCSGLAACSPALHAQEIQGTAAAAAIQQAFVDVIAAREKSVVAIGMFRTDNDPFGGGQGFNRDQTPSLDAIPDAYATGVIVDSEGLILTCWHALKDKHKKTRQYVRFAGKPVWWQVRVRAADPFSDLAVLEIVNAEATSQLKLEPMPLGDAKNLRKGQLVITLGNPYAIARDGEVSAGWGIVSNLRRKAPPQEGKRLPNERRPSLHHLGTLIQTDAKLNLGTSGGALLNLKGEMIGLTTSLAALEGYEKAAGYAIAVDETFRRVLKQLKEGREVEYGFLGVRLRDLTHHQRAAGWYGVRIEGVIAGGPASGKLLSGDMITHVGGQRINSVTEMMRAISQHAPETQIRLSVARTAQAHDRLVPTFLSVRLTKKHIAAENVIAVPRPAWRGIRVDYTTASELVLGTIKIDEGVSVQHILPDSDAAGSDLEVGQRITHVGDIAVNSPAEFLASVADQQGPVSLRVEPGSSVVVIAP
jgi:serine protease Do